MKMKISKKEKNFIMRFWKEGSFDSYKIVGSRDTIQKLEKIGILRKEGQTKYIINREKYIEIQKRLDEDQLKQKQLP